MLFAKRPPAMPGVLLYIRTACGAGQWFSGAAVQSYGVFRRNFPSGETIQPQTGEAMGFAHHSMVPLYPLRDCRRGSIFKRCRKTGIGTARSNDPFGWIFRAMLVNFCYIRYMAFCRTAAEIKRTACGSPAILYGLPAAGRGLFLQSQCLPWMLGLSIGYFHNDAPAALLVLG